MTPEKRLLSNLLQTQEFGEKTASIMTQKSFDNDFDYESDPISGVIVNAFHNNNNCLLLEDNDSAITDLEYAINQLTKAKIFLETRY